MIKGDRKNEKKKKKEKLGENSMARSTTSMVVLRRGKCTHM